MPESDSEQSEAGLFGSRISEVETLNTLSENAGVVLAGGTCAILSDPVQLLSALTESAGWGV